MVLLGGAGGDVVFRVFGRSRLDLGAVDADAEVARIDAEYDAARIRALIENNGWA